MVMKIISLADIAMYTDDAEVPLYDVLESIKEKEKSAQASIDPKKATPEQLREYLAEVLPNFDRERVYVADIKKLITWYNILTSNGITEFKPEEVKEEKGRRQKEKNRPRGRQEKSQGRSGETRGQQSGEQRLRLGIGQTQHQKRHLRQRQRRARRRKSSSRQPLGPRHRHRGRRMASSRLFPRAKHRDRQRETRGENRP